MSDNYKLTNLNDQLIPDDAPFAQRMGTTAYDTSSISERGVADAYTLNLSDKFPIQSFSASSAGTISGEGTVSIVTPISVGTKRSRLPILALGAVRVYKVADTGAAVNYVSSWITLETTSDGTTWTPYVFGLNNVQQQITHLTPTSQYMETINTWNSGVLDTSTLGKYYRINYYLYSPAGSVVYDNRNLSVTVLGA